MKKMPFLLSLCALLCAHFLRAEIVEISEISKITEHLKEGTLVVFDCDNVLIEPVQLLGSDQWGSYQIKKYQNEGLSLNEAIKRVSFEWTSIQNITAVQTPEKKTAAFVQQLQQQKIPLIGLTGRGFEMAPRTLDQLHTIGIDLSTTAPSQEEVLFKSDKTIHKAFSWVLFDHGILFTARMHKGEALFTLLGKLPATFERIVAIDDKLSALQQLEESCKKRGIPFVGLRYAYLDEKINNFSIEIAEKQFAHFVHLLSDAETSQGLQK